LDGALFGRVNVLKKVLDVLCEAGFAIAELAKSQRRGHDSVFFNTTGEEPASP